MDPEQFMKDDQSYISEKRDNFRLDLRKKKSMDKIKEMRNQRLKKLGSQEEEDTKNIFGDRDERIKALCQEYHECFDKKDLEQLYIVTEQIKRMISINEQLNPPFKVVLKYNILDKLLTLIENHQNANNRLEVDLLYMTLWVVSNLLWEESVVKYMIDRKTHVVLIQLLSFWQLKVKNQVLWCLANLSGTKDLKIKQILVESNIQKGLLELFEEAENIVGFQTKSNLTWICNNLTRPPIPPKQFLLDILHPITNICYQIMHEEQKVKQGQKQTDDELEAIEDIKLQVAYIFDHVKESRDALELICKQFGFLKQEPCMLD